MIQNKAVRDKNLTRKSSAAGARPPAVKINFNCAENNYKKKLKSKTVDPRYEEITIVEFEKEMKKESQRKIGVKQQEKI